MKLLSVSAVLFLSLIISMTSSAETGLVVHTTEFGVGKFHRADNKVHPYGEQHAWSPFILPDGVATDKPLSVKNADQSYTVFFSTLDEMLAAVVQISKIENRKIKVLNIHGHGLPGAMWFPKDEAALNGYGCTPWRDAVSGSDQANFEQYYSALTASDVRQIRMMSNGSSFPTPCTTGLKEWQQGVQKNPEFKNTLAADLQMHFLSCVVGLGNMGDRFTKGLAALLLTGHQGRIETSVNFGLGDWSMPEGMGFWDYINDEQITRDNEIYPVNRKDSEIAQKGSVRMASWLSGEWTTSVLTNQDVMSLQFEPLRAGIWVKTQEMSETPDSELPSSIRIVGTNVRVPLLKVQD